MHQKTKIITFHLRKTDIIAAMFNVVQIWYNIKPLRFMLAGAWNFLFGYSVFAGLYWFLNGLVYDWLIITIASVLGITMSYITHKFFTFRSSGCWWHEYLRFNIVYGIQSLFNILLIWIFVTQMRLNAYIIQLMILTMFTLASYWAHKNFSFKKDRI